jgi:shikimate kinase
VNAQTFDAAPIFLVGFMASGKTTLGTAVARLCDRRFIDLDQAIEQDLAMSVSQIFKTHGEAFFRDAETRMLKRLAGAGGVIIGCGGGTPCFGSNMDIINSAGHSVWLTTDVDRLVERLRLTPGQRPLIDALADDELADYVRAKLAEREPFYSRAHDRFDSSRLETEAQISDSAHQFAARFIFNRF